MEFFKRYLVDLMISRNSIFCNFCYKLTENNYYSLDDDVIFENNTSMKISDIIISLIGVKYIHLCASGILCQQCTSTLLNTYKFIEICKSNTEQIYNALQNIENNLRNATEKTKMHKSLYITLNTQTNSTQLLYDSETMSKDLTTVERLHKLIKNLQKNPKSELDSFDTTYFQDINETTTKTKNRKKKNNKIPIKENKKKLKTSKYKNMKKISINEIIHDINNMDVFKCKICLNNYPNFYKLKQHFFRIHAPKNFNCLECSKSYGSAALLTQHKNDSHRSLICSDCGKSYTSRLAFKTHMESHELHLMCQLCRKVFNNKRNFTNHMKLNICDLNLRRVNWDKKFICDYCKKRYSNKYTLRTHITFEHGKGAVHMCSWCNKKFNAVSRLTAHVVTHTQEKKFSCNVCNGRFVTKESLKYHTRIHTGERPYQCEYCDQRFLSTSRRAEHVRRRHKDPMVDCDICHSKFRSKSCLTRHKNRHFNPNSRLYYTQLVSGDKVCE